MKDTMTKVEDWEKEIGDIQIRTRQFRHQQHLIAFYGSSTIRLWENMKEDLHPYHVINLGFGGSTYADCVYYFEQAFEYLTPEAVILYAGDNDLANHQDTDEIVSNVETLILKLFQRYPGVKIGVIGIKPSLARKQLFHLLLDVNAKIKSLTEKYHLQYADSYSALTRGAEIPARELYIEDELHLSMSGYQIWTNMVKQTLLQMM